MIVYILGVKINDITMDQVVKKVEEWLEGEGKHQIVTTNPEFVMTAQEDEVFRKIINDADLSVPDGAGLKLGGRVKNTVPGVDLMEKLCGLAAEKGFTVGFLGGLDDVADKTAECLQKKYPNLKVSFANSVGKIADDGTTEVELPTTDILFVAFGYPRQDKWIAHNIKKIPVKVAMGVGGSFDYISGKVMRAPKFLRAIGMEWLFRLIYQPWRIKRQIKLLKYVWLVMID